MIVSKSKKEHEEIEQLVAHMEVMGMQVDNIVKQMMLHMSTNKHVIKQLPGELSGDMQLSLGITFETHHGITQQHHVTHKICFGILLISIVE